MSSDRKAYDRAWRKKNKAKVRAAQRRYHLRHRTKILAKRRRLYRDSPALREVDRLWRVANKTRVNAVRKAWALRNRVKMLVSSARKRARIKGVKFTVTENDITIPTHCPVFGFRFSKKVFRGNPRGPSIDRVVPRRGYVKGNVAVISLRANLLKSNASAKELEQILRWLKKNAA